MDYEYCIINQCLQLLKQSDLPTIKKLRVEIQLIQMKRLLLNDALPDRNGTAAGRETLFEGLLRQMQGICGGNCDGSNLTGLMERIGGMLTVLGGSQAAH